MTPRRRSEWTPDPGDPILHVPSKTILTLARILQMNGHTYYVCRKPEPHVGPPHAMLPASSCARPKPRRQLQPHLPDPEDEEE